MRRIRAVLCFLNFLLTISYIKSQLILRDEDNSCRTPDYKAGTCINIKRCEPLLQLLLQKPTPTEAVIHLQKSQCGFDGETPRVCCPILSTPSFGSNKPTKDHEHHQPNLLTSTNYYNQGSQSHRQTTTSRYTNTKPPTSAIYYPDQPYKPPTSNQIHFAHTTTKKPYYVNNFNHQGSHNSGGGGNYNSEDGYYTGGNHNSGSSGGTYNPSSSDTNNYNLGTHFGGGGTDPPNVLNHRNLKLINGNKCGYILNDRIIGGNKTKLFEFPWMALLAYKTPDGVEYQCGGTIISKNYILTAAHCLTGLRPGESLVGVRLGEHDIIKAEDCERVSKNREICAPPTQDYLAEEIITHPKFSHTKLTDDIGLIRIKGHANFAKENVLPICLPIGENQHFNSRAAVVTGWGVTEEGVSSEVLLKVDLPIVSNDKCAQVYRSSAPITYKQLCAGGSKGKDSCSGDSGGPLVYVGEVNGETRYIQQGVVSYGPKICGTEGKPGVYTRVAYYMDWILDHMRP